MRRSLAALSFALATTFSAAAQAPDAPEDTMLVFDASGSMWGQIEGVNKIVIARDVIEELILSMPAERRLGLVAYGHNREGVCDDIEVLGAVGTAHDELRESVRGLTPRGRTPLTESVRVAAEALGASENRSTVILVSDGLETCEADPCALARALEEANAAFTIHVVGFDVTAEERAGLSCMAEETGGLFLAADSADELSEALTQVADAGEPAAPEPVESEPVPSHVVLKATILNGGPQIQADLSWTVTATESGETVLSSEDAVIETELAPGDYSVEAVWTGWRDGEPRAGVVDFTVREQAASVITVPVDLGLPVSLDAPAETPEGVAIDVTWTGPDELGATVSVVRLDDGPRTAIFFFPAQRTRDAYEAAAEDATTLDANGDGAFDGNDPATGTLSIPPQAGLYEIRYTLSEPPLILARQNLDVTDSDYQLTASAEAEASSPITIEWSGPFTPSDVITLVPAGDERAFDNARYTPAREGEAAELTAPAEPGEYEIRYVMSSGYTTYGGMQNVVQASTPITVTVVTASLDAPSEAVGGSTISVVWDGPSGWSDDTLSVVERGSEEFNRDSFASLRGDAPAPTDIRVPAIAGEYDIVYLLNPGRRVIARRPLTITQPTATLEAPASVTAGESFEVSYSGDGFSGDRVVIVAADYDDARMWGVPATYGFGASPDGTSGEIAARLTATPGEYEIRYVTGLQHQVLARAPVTITE